MRLPRQTALVLLAALTVIAAAAAVSMAPACKVEPDPLDPARQQVLRDLVANVLVPNYADLASATAALHAATSALRQAPSAETLAAAQNTFRAARTQLKTSEAFLFGPIDDLLISGGAIDSWPAAGAKIDVLLSSESALDPAQVARLGADQRGFPGLEQLLFDSAIAPGEVLARFQTAPTAARRAELAESMASDLAAKCRAVRDAWAAPEGYGKQLAEAGVDSELFPTQSEGIDRVLTGVVALTELMAMKKLGKPLGLELGGTPQPQEEEAPRSDSSLADLRDNLLGIQAIYRGQRGDRDGLGLEDPVRKMNPGAADRFEQALAAAQAGVAAVPPPLRVALLENRPAVEAAYQAIRGVKQAILTDVQGALGASIGFGFSDTD